MSSPFALSPSLPFSLAPCPAFPLSLALLSALAGRRQLTAVMVPILYQIQQPEVDLKTPEEVGNYTFRANKFFRDQLLFSNEQLLTNLSSAFVGRYYAPGELIAARGTIPSMLIVENGTARVIPNNEEDRFQFKDNFQHGDAFGPCRGCGQDTSGRCETARKRAMREGTEAGGVRGRRAMREGTEAGRAGPEARPASVLSLAGCVVTEGPQWPP